MSLLEPKFYCFQHLMSYMLTFFINKGEQNRTGKEGKEEEEKKEF